MCIIANHDEAALAVLHHFVAVDDRVGTGTDLGPTCINLVGESIVPDDQFLWLPVPVNNGKSE